MQSSCLELGNEKVQPVGVGSINMCLYSEIPCIELCAQWALHHGPFETFSPLTDIQETYYSCI